MELLTGYLWRKGVCSRENEDSLTLQQIRCGKKICCMAIICDGIGGLAMGEVASGYVTEEMVKWFYQCVPEICVKRKSVKYVKRAVGRQLHRIHIGMKGIADKNEIRLGTTITMFLLIGTKGYVFHLGDSRMYCIRSKGKIFQMTKEHVRGQALIKALTGSSYQQPDIISFRIKSRNTYMLCSDGVWKYLDNNTLRDCFCSDNIMTEEMVQKRLNELGNMVIRRGTKDDVSVIYIKVH